MANSTLIIWDYDDTLVDTSRKIIGQLKKMYSHLSLREIKEINDCIPLSTENLFKKLTELNLELRDFESFKTELMILEPLESYFFNWVPPLISALHKQGVVQIVCSNEFSRKIIYNLEKSNLSKFFTSVISSADLGIEKTNSIMIERALKKIGFNPQSTVLIGDSKQDEDLVLSLNINFLSVRNIEEIDTESAVDLIGELVKS